MIVGQPADPRRGPGRHGAHLRPHAPARTPRHGRGAHSRRLTAPPLVAPDRPFTAPLDDFAVWLSTAPRDVRQVSRSHRHKPAHRRGRSQRCPSRIYQQRDAPSARRAQYIAVQESPEFQELRSTAAPLRVSDDGVLPRLVRQLTSLLGAFAHDFMATKVFGNVNVGLLLGLGQFVTTFVITGLYVRFANRSSTRGPRRSARELGERGIMNLLAAEPRPSATRSPTSASSRRSSSSRWSW